MTITSACLKVNAKLHGLSITDAASETMYKNIISSVGDGDVLKMEFINYNNATEGQEAFENTNNVDTSVTVRVRRVFVAFSCLSTDF